MPLMMNDDKELFKVMTKKAVLPSKEELLFNSRSHSAKLRAAVKQREEG